MDDFPKPIEFGLRFVVGTPAYVEVEIELLKETFVCSNLYFYVVKDELQVCATLVNKSEVEKQQAANRLALLPPNWRPN